jgi:hypothetical protein
MKKFVLILAAYTYVCNPSAHEESKKQVVHGKLMIIPKTEADKQQTLMQGFVCVWAYNKYSVHWHAAGYPDLDQGKEKDRFPACLPYDTLQYLHEGSLFVFEQNGKEFMLTCANYGTRYGKKPFEYYLKHYDGVERWFLS